MQDWIKEKLDKIDELFPPERIKASKRRLTDIWNGKLPQDRLAYFASPSYINYYNDYNSPEESDIRLSVLLDECIIHGRLDDDFIPSLFPGCRQSTIPNMFKADEVVVDNDYACKRIITKPGDIDDLPDPEILPNSVAQQWLDRQSDWLEKTEGRLPIHVVDMQGPVDSSAQMFGYDELFLCAYTDPERFHKLLHKTSQAFCLFWESQKKLLGDNFVPTHLFGWTWIPNEGCASLSADSMVMISPDFFDEFFKPHFDRISRQFGGLVVHSCGDFTQVIKNIQGLYNLRAINASELNLRQLKQGGLKNDCVVVHSISYDDVPDDVDVIKQARQPVLMSVDLYPSECSDISPNDWTDSDWDVIAKRQDCLLETLVM